MKYTKVMRNSGLKGRKFLPDELRESEIIFLRKKGGQELIIFLNNKRGNYFFSLTKMIKTVLLNVGQGTLELLPYKFLLALPKRTDRLN